MINVKNSAKADVAGAPKLKVEGTRSLCMLKWNIKDKYYA